MDNSTFSLENSVQNSKYEENFSIRSGNKIENILPKDSFLKIPSSIETQSPPHDDFSPVIPSGITFYIPTGTNSNILCGDISLIPPRDFSKIPEDTYAVTFYKSTPSATTNSKIHLVNPDYTTYVKSNSDSTSDPISLLKLRDSKIYQQIWSCIFNDKQYPKDLKRYNENKNDWHNAKENWDATISAA